jgi:hypothetical protein
MTPVQSIMVDVSRFAVPFLAPLFTDVTASVVLGWLVALDVLEYPQVRDTIGS